MPDYAGRGDAARTMALLWGRYQPATRGPKPGLDLATIVDTAIAIADAEGLAGLSMRRVGQQLGKTAMALYTYVPGKGELLDLMLDRVLKDAPTLAATEEGWRPAVEALARGMWQLFVDHPWMLQVAGGRTTLGPNEFDVFEAAARPFVELGLTGRDVAQLIGMVESYLRGSAQAVSDARAAEQATGVSDQEWWEARLPFLQEYMSAEPADRWPSLTWLNEQNAYAYALADDGATPYLEAEALANFEFGLHRVLDGVEAHIERHANRAPTGEAESIDPH